MLVCKYLEFVRLKVVGVAVAKLLPSASMVWGLLFSSGKKVLPKEKADEDPLADEMRDQFQLAD